MISGVLLCAVFCACVVLWWRARVRESHAHPLPPACPFQLPIIGHTLKLIASNDTSDLWELGKLLAKCTIERGGVSYINFGPQIYYVITNPEDALTVANTCMQKNFLYSYVERWLGQGLITSSGEVWHRHRKLLNPMFSLPVIHGFLQVFNEQSRELLSSIDHYAGKGPVDLSLHVRKTALEISCLTAFGESGVKDKIFISKYMQVVEEILSITMLRFQKFWLQSETIYILSGLKKREIEQIKTLKELSDTAISKTRAACNKGDNIDASFNSTKDLGYQPILDLILQQKSKCPFNDQEIREELDTTIVAGYETTSKLLLIALVLIGSHPEVQENINKEIIEVIGLDRDVEKEDLQKLYYLDAVIKECLRFLSTVPAVVRYIDKDVKLKTCTLRAGSQCLLLLLGIHRDPSWGPDADQFRPERWLDATTLPKNPNAFAAFSVGKRSCIGKTYAMTSAKVFLAHMVRRYRLAADFTKMKFKVDVTLNPTAGHEISLQRRN